MPPNAEGQWKHEGAEVVGENDWCGILTWRCKDCGQDWEQELPQ